MPSPVGVWGLAPRKKNQFCAKNYAILSKFLYFFPILQHTRSSADADNRLDAFSGQSRSTNMVPFHRLHMVSYCAIVTLSLRHADIRLQKISLP